jgi:hypothetical protein
MGHPERIAQYAKWAVQPNGSALWATPSPDGLAEGAEDMKRVAKLCTVSEYQVLTIHFSDRAASLNPSSSLTTVTTINRATAGWVREYSTQYAHTQANLGPVAHYLGEFQLREVGNDRNDDWSGLGYGGTQLK